MTNLTHAMPSTGAEAHIGYVGPFPTKPGQQWQKPFATWKQIEYPIEADKHFVGSSDSVKINNAIGEVHVGYTAWSRTGDQIGNILDNSNDFYFSENMNGASDGSLLQDFTRWQLLRQRLE